MPKRALVGEAPRWMPGALRPVQIPIRVAVLPYGFPDPGLTVVVKATVAVPRLDQPHV